MYTGEFRRVFRRRVATKVDTLAQQALGCGASLAAVLGHDDGDGQPKSFGDVVDFLSAWQWTAEDRWNAVAMQRFKALSFGMRDVKRYIVAGNASEQLCSSSASC